MAGIELATRTGRLVITAAVLGSGMALLDGTVVNVALVRIGEDLDASLAELGRWPWPRAVMAEFIDRLVAQRPRAVALDILFVDADPQGDEALAAALRRAGNVALAASYRFGGPAGAAPDFMASSAYAGWRLDRGGRAQVALEAAALAGPIPELGRAAAALGHVTVAFDVDGFVFDGFKTQVSESVTPARFEQVQRLVVKNSPVLEGVKSE